MQKIFYDAFIPCITNRDKIANVQKYAFYSKNNNNKIKKYNIVKKNNKSILNLNSIENDNLNRELSKKIIDELNNETILLNNTINNKNSLNLKIISSLIIIFLFLIGIVSNPFRSKTVSFGISIFTLGLSFTLINKIKNTKKRSNFEYIIEVIKNSDGISNDKNLNKILTNIQFKDDVYLVYSKFLDHFSKEKNIGVSEIELLYKIKNIFDLSPQELGNCHFQSAQNLYRNSLIMSERKENSSEMYITNFLFLSDVLLSNDSKKGYQYEMNRLKKTLLLTKDSLINEAKNKKINVYQNLLLELFSSDINDKKKKIDYFSSILSLDSNQIKFVHTNLIKMKINEIIKSYGKFDSSTKIELSKICSFLEVDESMLKILLNDETFDVAKKILMGTLEELNEENIDLIVKKIQDISLEFLLSNESLVIMFKDIVSRRIKKNLDDLINIKQLSPFSFNEKIENFLLENSNIEKLSMKLNLIYSSDKNCDFKISVDEIIKTFDFESLETILISYLKNATNELKITDKIIVNLSNLAQNFGFNDNKIKSILRIVIGPIYQNEILKIIEQNNYNNFSYDMLENVEKSLKIDQETIFINKKASYLKFLEKKVSNNSILSNDDIIEIDNVINFLGINFEIIQNINDTTLEPIFKKATEEALGANYIIPSNYWIGLEKLRKRLRISERKSKEIFYSCITDKLKTILEKAIIDNKKKNSPKENVPKDVGEDPTINKDSGTTLGIEVEESENNQMFNLVDIYFRNNIFSLNESLANNLVQETLIGLSGRNVQRFQSINSSEMGYPINLRHYFDDKTIKNMYKEYLISCFSVKQQTQKRRLFNNLDKLAPILGLNKNEISEIHTEVGSLIFNRYLSQVLSKGYLDDSDKSFLGSIQSTLSMNNKDCVELIKNSKKNMVSLNIEKIFMSPKVSPDGVKKLLLLIRNFGVNIESDLSISLDQRQKLFRVAIEDAIENEEIKTNQNIISDIQNSFVIDEVITKKILLDVITNKSEGYLLNAIGSLRQGKLDNALIELRNMLKYGRIFTISLNDSVGSTIERQKLIELFKNNNSNDFQSIKILEDMMNF
ncbi:IAP100 protein [Guillardia theta]|uniref:IAP100 protein n=2 Tax=Guillardia theta TaxID=55529 RepID=Q9AW67_GUITH|nr:IAP100 protein [Guillardia theta]CAC27003.1 IAP100 protein [Guillardia theta]